MRDACLSCLHIQLVLQMLATHGRAVMLEWLPALPLCGVQAPLEVPLGRRQLSFVSLGCSCMQTQS